MAFGFTQSTGEAKERLERIYGADEAMGEAEVSEVMGILERLDALEYAQSVAEEKSALAMGVAREAGSRRSSEELQALAHFFAHRDH